MTFSPLTATTAATKNYSSRKDASVTRLIVHYTAGGTDASNVDLLSNSQKYGREASCTYVLRRDGSLVGIVPEEHRPWTSGGQAADGPSITVETVISATGQPTTAQLETLAKLAADLCKRYGWGKLDRTRIRGHREFANTDCPGPLWPRLDSIVARANTLLAPKPAPPKTAPTKTRFVVTASALNARTGPGTNYPIVGGAPKGTVIAGTGKTNGSWIEGATPYQLKAGTTAWYHRNYLKASKK